MTASVCQEPYSSVAFSVHKQRSGGLCFSGCETEFNNRYCGHRYSGFDCWLDCEDGMDGLYPCVFIKYVMIKRKEERLVIVMCSGKQ